MRRKLHQVEVGDIQHKNKLTPYLGRVLRGVVYRLKQWNYGQIGKQNVGIWMILYFPALLLEVKKCIPKRKASKVWRTFKICQGVVSCCWINYLLLEFGRMSLLGPISIINTRSPLWSALASWKIKAVKNLNPQILVVIVKQASFIILSNKSTSHSIVMIVTAMIL